ncbi:MAG: hypothetical protein C4297_01040 [Gemmataceae bacterium]
MDRGYQDRRKVRLVPESDDKLVRSWCTWAGLFFLLLAIYGSLIPFWVESMELSQARRQFLAMPMQDFFDLEARGDWMGTVLLYAVVGLLLAGALSGTNSWTARLFAGTIVTSFGWLLALAIEFAQVFCRPRTVSLNDVILTSVGMGLGSTLWLVCGPHLARWCLAFRTVRSLEETATHLAPAVFIGLACVEAFPFDFMVSAEEMQRKLSEGRIHLGWPVQTGAGQDVRRPTEEERRLWNQAAAGASVNSRVLIARLSTFAGFMIPGSVLGLSRFRTLGTALVLCLGFSLSAAIELLQLWSYSRYFYAVDVPLGMAGVWLGWSTTKRLAYIFQAGTMRFRRPRVSERLLAWARTCCAAGVLMWSAALIAFYWRPYDFLPLSEDGWPPRRINWIPLADYYWNSKYGVFVQILVKGGSFAPLGLFGACFFSGKYKTFVLVYAGLVALVVEMGQAFLPKGYPSTTDWLVQTGGALIGFMLMRAALCRLAQPKQEVGSAYVIIRT